MIRNILSSLVFSRIGHKMKERSPVPTNINIVLQIQNWYIIIFFRSLKCPVHTTCCFKTHFYGLFFFFTSIGFTFPARSWLASQVSITDARTSVVIHPTVKPALMGIVYVNSFLLPSHSQRLFQFLL